ncbi:MAG: hypothetical protein HY554_17140 [Elusimicrobia bacterium]|nr:hypothetical protein [Elusimicrobiota bacterium]
MELEARPAPAPVPFRGSAPFLAKAPPLWLPMRHFVLSAAAWWVFAAGFAWGADRFLGFDFQARWVLGLTHVLTLGWVAATIFGALCQLTPVLWETSLASETAAKAAWWLLAAGLLSFVGLIWGGGDQYWRGAALLAGAVALYLFVFGRTMRSARKLDWTGVHLLFAFAYLAALVAVGAALAWDRQRGILFRSGDGALIAHVHLALVGWVSLTIVGVSYRLVSMFALAHVETKVLGRLTLTLVNVGLVGLALDSLYFGRRLTPLWASLLALAYLAYAAQMRKIFSARLKRIDPALAFTLLALAGGALWCALGLGLAFGWLEDTTESRLAYVFAALVGWVTPFIIGQMHKIVPFLVWLHAYSPRHWTPPVRVPTIQDLTSERTAWLELAALALGAGLGVAAFLSGSQPLLRASGAFLLACATLYAGNIGYTLSHLRKKGAK